MRFPRRRGSAISLLTRLCFPWLPMSVSVSKQHIDQRRSAGGVEPVRAAGRCCRGQSPGQSQDEAAQQERRLRLLPRHDRSSQHAHHRHRATWRASIATAATATCMRPAGADMRRLRAAPSIRRIRSRAIPSYADTSANPVRAYTDWLKEDKEYIRFVNPGDLRVADETCGNCHAQRSPRGRRPA